VTVAVPRSLDEAFAALAAEPDAHLLMGGTDLMVEVNYGHRRPPAVVALDRVPELRGWERSSDGRSVLLRAGLTYTEMESADLAALLPALAQAARTVGSPQIRNAGTIGGNLATASPAGDTLPVLAALDATIVLGSAGGQVRELAWDELIVGVKRTTRRPDEIILGARVPVRRGPQEFLKVGTRNAMVIAVASVAVIVDLDAGAVSVGLGSVGPVPLRAREAEAWVAERLRFDGPSGLTTVDGSPATATDLAAEFGRLVANAARPIDDQRSSAVYRTHAIGVCARRALMRALSPEVVIP
jgi:CO/xanthine dehydrogenase FAD-binding subunit